MSDAQALYEARVRTSPEGCRALARATLGRRPLKKSLAALAVAILSGVALWKTDGHALPAAFLAVSLAFLLFFLRTEQRVAQRMLSALPDAGAVTALSFTRDAILTRGAGGESSRIAYGDIRRMWASPDFFLFYLADDSAFALSKRGVTAGDPATLAPFLEARTGLSMEAVR